MEDSRTKIIYSLLLALFILIWGFLFFPNNVSASTASLYLSPTAGTYTVGNTFSVQLKVNTGGVAVNAADGTLVFDPDKLEVKSVSKSDSVFSLWVQDPVFSNSLGTINFAGGKPTPGYTGAAGTIIAITFKAKTAGTATVSFASGSVLADDGKGTNVLANIGSGSYQLTGREIVPLPQPEEPSPGKVSSFPEVQSSTHPDEEKWYSNNDPEFNWVLPSGITGVSLLLHKKPDANPGYMSDGLISSKKYEDIEDGVWYFHIKFQNKSGWGETTHRKVLIDTAVPLPFELKFQKEYLIDPGPTLFFETFDELSGLDRYQVKLDANDLVSIEPGQAGQYELEALEPGLRKIEVKAIDMAGNSYAASVDAEISPIETPIVTKYPERLTPDEKLELEGKSLPGVSVLVFLQERGKEPILEEVKSDDQGNWLFVSSKTLEKGNYEIWTLARDQRGAQSLPSAKLSVSVEPPPFLKFGRIAFDYLNVVITLLVLLLGAVVMVVWSWYRIVLWRRRLRKETEDIDRAVSSVIKVLREEIEKQVEYFDGKQGLSPYEKKIRSRLKKSVDISEKFIEKEIKDVKKELK